MIRYSFLSVVIVCGLVLGGCASSTDKLHAKQVATPETAKKPDGIAYSYTDSWIEAMLESADKGGPFEISNGFLIESGVTFLSEEEILMFIKEGPPAISALIPHVHDERLTGISFQNPLSSVLDMRPKKVGLVACYLIEAILRENPHFTKAVCFASLIPGKSRETTQGGTALRNAALAYETWFAECYDEETQSITCPPGQFPEVPWLYDLKWWDWYRNTFQKGAIGAYDLQRCKKADEDLAGKTVKGTLVGDRGYMLMLSDDSWISCYLPENPESATWDYGTTQPTSDDLQRLGDLFMSFINDDRNQNAQKATGKTFECTGPGELLWLVFRDGSCLRPWRTYYSDSNQTCLELIWDTDNEYGF